MTPDTMVSDLVDILHSVTEGRLVDLVDVHGPTSIRRLGLDSVTTLAFLVAVEDAFGIEWDDYLPEDVLTSFDAMARHLLGELAGADR